MPKTLLLADDSVTIQKVVGISFASEDIELITVDNGDDAVTRAQQARPDLVLADVVMPGKNGYEVCEAIKADESLRHVPVLLLTGTFEAFDEARAQQVGAAGHIAKPFEAQALVDEVKRLLAEVPAAAPPAPAPAAPPAADLLNEAPVADTSPPTDPNADSFDFFDDDVAVAPPAADVGASGPVAIDAPDSAFEFGEEELSPADAPALAEPANPVETPPAADDPLRGSAPPVFMDAGIDPAQLAGEEPSSDSDPEEPSLTVAGNLLGAEIDPEASLTPLGSSGDGHEPFDFAFEGPAADADDDAMLDADDFAQSAVLDPNGASGYDVSSSDLGSPLETSDPTDPAATVLAPEFAAQPEPESPFDAAPEPESPFDAAPESVSPFDAVPELDEPMGVEPAVDPVEEPMESVASLETDDDAGDVYATTVIAPDFAETPPAQSADPISPAQPESPVLELAAPVAGPEPSAVAASVLEQLEPRLRSELHDTLEKIAWESFGNLTDAIVRQSVEKVEAIAWEVIPQLAESLIREEIRKLKGEPSDDS